MALKVGGLRTKKATVTQALREYIQHRRQAHVLKLFGKIEMQPDYDYGLRGVVSEGCCGTAACGHLPCDEVSRPHHRRSNCSGADS
jgi:hypothetical protein